MIHCPICKVNSKEFLPGGEGHDVLKEFDVVGAGLRDNMYCPICYSKDRDRSIYLFLLKETNVFKKAKVILHASPSSVLKTKFKEIKDVEYLDTFLHNNGDNMQMGLTRIPFPDQFFDLLVANHILEHIPNDALALKEIYRVLKPEGRAVLQVPLSLTLMKTMGNPSQNNAVDYGQHDHVRIYGSDYMQRLKNAGFKVSKFNFSDKYGKSFVKKHALIEDEIIFDILK